MRHGLVEPRGRLARFGTMALKNFFPHHAKSSSDFRLPE